MSQEFYMNEYEKWVASPALSDDAKAELAGIKDDDNEIRERFTKMLAFGTAGLRGIMRQGLNGMNIYMVRLATQGLAELIIEESGGGVTFSGGECMLQIDFLEALCRACREKGIHTAIDTAGCVPWARFERVLPYASLFLYDMKARDPRVHRRLTGADNALILDNLERLLDAGASVNDAEYSPDSSVLLEALNVKAAPEIIRLLVARGADTSREGEVFDAKSGETFRGNAAQLAAARGYGADVIGLLK